MTVCLGGGGGGEKKTNNRLKDGRGMGGERDKKKKKKKKGEWGWGVGGGNKDRNGAPQQVVASENSASCKWQPSVLYVYTDHLL